MRFQWELRLADGERVSPSAVAFRPRRMARIVAMMTELKMTVDAGPQPKFPLWALYGVSDFDAAGHPVGGRAAEYEAALRAILNGHGHTAERGIPLHKLRTNLGWHVTTDECRAALESFDAWRRPGEPSPSVFGQQLIPFLRAAVVHNGFEVH